MGDFDEEPSWVGTERRSPAPPGHFTLPPVWDALHHDVIRLVEKNSVLTQWTRAVVFYVVPALAAYLVYDHQQLVAAQIELVRIASALGSVDANGTKFTIAKAASHHADAGCHFTRTKK